MRLRLLVRVSGIGDLPGSGLRRDPWTLVDLVSLRSEVQCRDAKVAVTPEAGGPLPHRKNRRLLATGDVPDANRRIDRFLNSS
jgi:hypothetical protein